MKTTSEPSAGQTEKRIEIEDKIIHILSSKLRESGTREELVQATRADHGTIEEILTSESFRRRLASVLGAVCWERTATLVATLFDQAEAKQSWAWKILLDVTGLAEALREIALPTP